MSQKGGKMCQMESVRRSINEHMTSVGEEILCVLEKQQRGADVCCVKLVRAFVLERLSAAAEFMFNLFQRETETLQTLLDSQNKLLEVILQPNIKLRRADFMQLPVCKDEVSHEQQKRSPSLVQEEPEPPQIKEEEVELLQIPEETDGSTQTLLAVKREDDDENRETEPVASTSTEHIKTQAYIKYWVSSQTTSKDQPSNCYESGVTEDTEPVASTSTQHMTTRADVEGCGTSQATSDNQLFFSSPCSESDTKDSDDWAPHSSESETEDIDDWGETREGHSALNTLKTHKTQRVERQRLSSNDKQTQDLKSSKQTHSMRSRTREKSFICAVCGKGCVHSGELKTHMRVHTGEKPFTCKVCGKCFSQLGNLTTHMRIHTGEKPFSCAVCGKGFAQKIDAKTHIRTHTGEKPFTCGVCGKGCGRIDHLKTHMMTHTGEKPFTCTVCGKGCVHMGQLNQHMRTHTGVRK